MDSTKAAVRYLKTLHGMFAGDWRLAVMAYNAGEYRILGALKRGGQQARNAKPEQLPGLSDITHAYVRKLHALSCLMEQADDREDWLRALDRPVPKLAAVTVPDDVADIAGWAARSGHDAAQLQRLNPVFGNGRIGKVGSERAPLLAIAPSLHGRGAHRRAQSASTVSAARARRLCPAVPADRGGFAGASPHRGSRRQRLDPRAAIRHPRCRPSAAQRPDHDGSVLKPGRCCGSTRQLPASPPVAE